MHGKFREQRNVCFILIQIVVVGRDSEEKRE
jgi:hypothetical protein